MNDKKDYKTTLKIIDATATSQAILNQLSGLAVDTDDERLRELLSALSARIRQLGAKSSDKMRLIVIPKAHPFSGPVAEVVAATVEYCNSCIHSCEKQWQILARQAGWTPPTAG